MITDTFFSYRNYRWRWLNLLLLVALLGKMRSEQARLADEHQRALKELEAARARLQEVEAASAEMSSLREERDLIRARVGSLLEQLEGLNI